MTIAATLDLLEASRRTWDVAIVGAGPAGAMAARELARRGQDVVLIDHAAFPRWKVCGCCLNGHALATLDAAELGPMIARSGAVPLSGIRLAAAGRVAKVSLSGGVALSREAFDAALILAAIQSGAAFLPQTWAALERSSGTSEVRCLELHQGPIRHRLAARVVLAADGLGGKLVARTGVREGIALPGRASAPAWWRPQAPRFTLRVLFSWPAAATAIWDWFVWKTAGSIWRPRSIPPGSASVEDRDRLPRRCSPRLAGRLCRTWPS